MSYRIEKTHGANIHSAQLGHAILNIRLQQNTHQFGQANINKYQVTLRKRAGQIQCVIRPDQFKYRVRVRNLLDNYTQCQIGLGQFSYQLAIFLERDESLLRENHRMESDVRNDFGDVNLARDAVFDRTDLHTGFPWCRLQLLTYHNLCC